MHVSLTEALDRYVRERVATGLYNNASEVVREALREKIAAEKDAEARLSALRAEIDRGWEEADRGAFADFDPRRIDRDLDAELYG